LIKLAEAFETDARFSRVKALRVRTNFVTRNGSRQLQRMADHLHFEFIRDDQPESFWGRLHDFGENFLVWALIRTFNPADARATSVFYIAREVNAGIWRVMPAARRADT
jgi:hypothetical protein